MWYLCGKNVRSVVFVREVWITAAYFSSSQIIGENTITLLLIYPLSLCFFHLVFSLDILLCYFRLIRSGFSLLSSASVLAGDSWRLSDQISHVHRGVQRQLW